MNHKKYLDGDGTKTTVLNKAFTLMTPVGGSYPVVVVEGASLNNAETINIRAFDSSYAAKAVAAMRAKAELTIVYNQSKAYGQWTWTHEGTYLWQYDDFFSGRNHATPKFLAGMLARNVDCFYLLLVNAVVADQQEGASATWVVGATNVVPPEMLWLETEGTLVTLNLPPAPPANGGNPKPKKTRMPFE